MARQIRPGQLQENALYDISSSYAVTASFALNGGGGSTFPFVGDAVITGSLTVSGSNSAVNLQEVQFDTNHSASGHTTGRIYWDDNNKTFTGDMQGSDVRLQIGQEEHVYVFNNSGVTINNGDAVRISGANGANVTITKAVSSIKSFKDETEQDQILGVATEQIADNQRGYVTTFGAVRDLDTSAFSEGDILYLSATTSGSYSNIRPAAPNFEARVGVVQIANATEGVVLVRPQEPTFLTDISQVTSSGVVTDEKAYLVYDDNTDLISFTNEFSGSFSGSFQGNGSALTNLTLPNGTVTGSAQISELGFVTSSATSSFVLNSQTSSFVNNSATASFVLNSQTASMSVESASFAVTASHLLNNPPAFPFTGDAQITGSLIVSGSNNRIEGSTVIYSTSTPGLTIQSNADTAEEVKIYDARIDIEDSGYMAARLSSNAYGSRAGVLDLRHWAGNVGAVITAQPSYTSYIQSSLLIGKTGTVNSSHAYKLDVNGDIKLGNGTDDSIEILGPVTASTDISSSATSTASFGTYIGDGSQLIGVLTTASVSLNTITFTKGDGSTFPITVDTGSGGGGGGVPSGTVSSSAQITELGFVTSSATASFVLNSQTSSMSVATASYIEYSNVANKPALVSGSAQISYAGITDIPAGILSSSAQIATDISGAFSSDSASFSTRVTANETSITSLNLVTGSYAITGSNTFTGNQTINGNLTVYGTGSFDVIHTIYETSSIIYASGSTKFGDTMDDTHIRTGSMFITGSVTALDYTGIFNGALSSSAQIATEISGAFATDSASFSTRITTNETNISTLTAATSSYLTATPTLQQVTDQGASTSNDITISGDLTASADISLPTNASYIKFNNAEIYGRVGGSYPGLHLASGQSSNSRIWLGDLANTTGAVTMSFLGVNNLFDNINNLRAGGNRPLILQGGAGPNDVNDGVRIQTGDASNVYQTRFEIEADGANVDAYFTNINGLGINDSTPTAMLDVNGNINTTSHITASGNILATGTVLGSNLSGTNTGDQDLSSYALITAVTGAFASDSASFSTRVTTLEGAGTSTPTFIASGSTSASAAPDTGVVVEHSGSTAFSVIGDVGTLFSVDDSLTGTLFSANDISGFPVLQAEADGDVYLGKSPQSLYTTAVISSNTANITQSIYGISTSSYAGAFIEYTAFSGSHDARAGSLMAIWSGSAVNFTETTTTDFGNTSNLLMQVAISQSQAQVQSYSTTAGYKIKTIIKAI